MGRRELEVQAPDGRRLCAQVSGPQDGPLIIFHAGTPGTRHLYEGHLEDGSDRGLRHVCCSRPGYDGSDRQAGRSVADCAADTVAVAETLDAESFYVVGHSGGGPHALACAALLPDRVVSAAVLSSFAPRSSMGLDFGAEFKELNRDELEAFEAGDAALERFLDDAVSMLRRIKDSTQLRHAFGDSLCAADLDCLDGAFLDYQLVGCARAVRGDIWGWFDDDQAVWGEWGFDPAQITVPVTIWHGRADGFVPAANGEWLASQLSASRVRLLAKEGHISLLARYYGAVLDEMVSLST